MKKTICLLLCFWLPLFFSAASFASTDMQLAEVLHATQLVAAPMVHADNAMPDDCPMAKMDHGSKSDKTAHGKCQHCGFCVSMAFYPATAIVHGDLPYHLLSAHIAWASTSHIPPADQRPPIVL
jgi:hypothetical protein